MTDGWEDGFNDSLDDGHEFAEDHLLLPGGDFEEEGGKGSLVVGGDTPLAGGVIAEFQGTCVVEGDQINVGDEIKKVEGSGWRHVGCIGAPTHLRDTPTAAEWLYSREQEIGSEEGEAF